MSQIVTNKRVMVDLSRQFVEYEKSHPGISEDLFRSKIRVLVGDYIRQEKEMI